MTFAVIEVICEIRSITRRGLEHRTNLLCEIALVFFYLVRESLSSADRITSFNTTGGRLNSIVENNKGGKVKKLAGIPLRIDG